MTTNLTIKQLLLFLFTVTWFLASPSPVALAQTGDVRGFVYDKDSGEPIIFTNVYLEGTSYGAATNIEGFYSINKVPAGDYVLVSTFVGYDTTRVEVTIKAERIISQQLYIEKLDIVLGEFVVGGEKQESQSEVRTSTIKISPKQIQKIPAIGGEPDLAQYLQILPGVVFTGDQGGQLYIRGGSLIQTKVLIDGITVYNPFHSIGLFSVFETELIRNVEVLTGGFNAEYGGRISAIIDIAMRDGNKKRLKGTVSANTFLAKAVLEGPLIKLKDNGLGLTASYVLSAKGSYLDQSSKALYSYVDSTGLPYNFLDLYGKISLNASNGSKFSLSGYRFTDNAIFQQTSEFGWDTWGMGGKFVMVPGQSKTIIDGYFSFSNYDIELKEGDEQPRNSSIGGFNGGVNFAYFFPNGDLRYGIEVSGFSTKFNFFNSLGLKIEEDQNTTEIGGFLKYKTKINNLLLEPSVRINYYASLSEFTFEPRLGGKYNLSDDFRLKFSGGYYTQNFISTKSDRDIVNLFTGFLSAPESGLPDITGEIAANNLQAAWHGILGVELDLTRRLTLNVEGYYKDFAQLININRNKLFPQDPNYIIEKGNAYGIDFLVKYDYKNLFLWGVYSLSWVNRDDGEQVYPPHFDKRHNMNFLASYTFGKGETWEASIRWNLGSGFPFTKTQGFFEMLDLVGGVDANYEQQNGNLGIIYDDQINGGRLPFYHRLDLSIKKRWPITEQAELEASFSVTNVYDRENIFYFDRVRYERVNQLPILPSAGVSFSF